MSDRPLRDALDRLDDLKAKRGELGVILENGDIGAQGELSVPVAKGGSLAAAGRYMKEAGYRFVAKLGWTW